MSKKKTPTELSCTKCGNTWTPRRAIAEQLPKSCPRCKSYQWNDAPKPLGRPRKVAAVAG